MKDSRKINEKEKGKEKNKNQNLISLQSRMASIKKAITERKEKQDQENHNIPNEKDYTVLIQDIEKAFQNVHKKVLLSKGNVTWPK